MEYVRTRGEGVGVGVRGGVGVDAAVEGGFDVV